MIIYKPDATATLRDNARYRFNEWCGLDAPELPGNAYDAMQLRLVRWQRTNFGIIDDVENALGMAEEMGELDEAETESKVIDAMGDVMIYGGHVLMMNRFAISPFLSAIGEGGMRQGRAIGRLSHLVLKRKQSIRGGLGSKDVYQEMVARRILDVFESAWALLISGAPEDGTWPSPHEIYLKVGAEVMGRDWVRWPVTGRAS